MSENLFKLFVTQFSTLLHLKLQQRAELRDEELKKIFAHGGIPFAS